MSDVLLWFHSWAFSGDDYYESSRRVQFVKVSDLTEAQLEILEELDDLAWEDVYHNDGNDAMLNFLGLQKVPGQEDGRVEEIPEEDHAELGVGAWFGKEEERNGCQLLTPPEGCRIVRILITQQYEC